MSRVILLAVALLGLLCIVYGQYAYTYDYEPVDEEWTVMGVEYAAPLQYATTKSAPMQYYTEPVQYTAPKKSAQVQYQYTQPLQYAAPLKSSQVQYQYSAPVKAAPLTYATIQVPETSYQTVYTNAPQKSYNIVPIITLKNKNNDDDDDDNGNGNGNGNGKNGNGNGNGQFGGAFVTPGMGGFGGLGYGAKGGFGGMYGADGYPIGTYFGFPTIAFIGGDEGGHGGHGGH